MKATITAAPATAPPPLPMDNVKELMMKLIQENPSYLTSGIPNDLLTQLIMTSNKAVAKPAPSAVPTASHPPSLRPITASSGNHAGHQQHNHQRILMTPGDAMKVKQPIVYNVCFDFLFSSILSA